VYQDFELVNYNYAEFNFDQAKDPSFEAGFNTETQSKSIIGNEKLFKNFGFNVSGRYNTLIYGNLHSGWYYRCRYCN
jgi:hypothetical protein